MPFPKGEGILAPSSLAESPSSPFSKKLSSGVKEEGLFFLRFGVFLVTSKAQGQR